ncbi:NAD(P)-dependent oxidoreductase [Parvularcula sp. IMCC14364]|uniref:NAD(P)-dependent oxidoreductase n=1 Tax=Parvularcula sp. IMCC14364 TaxID=3067902 RepID=UPI0027414DAC|nr:NAD(P)-dependent oxidoreductase [Parvularcula sp. IMCC14364]
MKCAFLGLGVMGYPMAGHLANAGHEMTVYNRTEAKTSQWSQDYKGTVGKTPELASAEADVVFACVGNDEDSLAVGGSAIAVMPAGSVYVDHTTTSASCAEKLAAIARERQVGFVDAPVSGGEAGAVNGALSVMCGGAAEHLKVVSPLMASYAKRVVHIGPVGHGQLCKSVNQIAIAGLLQGLSEAVAFAKASGVNTDKTLEAISGGAAQSWQMENRWHTMVQGKFDFGFAVEWMRKDLDIVFSEGDRFAADLAVTRLIDSYYEDVEKQGGKRWDTSSLVSRIDKS